MLDCIINTKSYWLFVYMTLYMCVKLLLMQIPMSMLCGSMLYVPPTMERVKLFSLGTHSEIEYTHVHTHTHTHFHIHTHTHSHTHTCVHFTTEHHAVPDVRPAVVGV